MQELPIKETIWQIQLGVHGNCLRRLSGAIPCTILSDTLGTDRTNLAKIYHRQLSRLETEQINELSLLWYELRKLFEDDQRLMKTWLLSPTPILSGISPQSLMSTIIDRQSSEVVSQRLKKATLCKLSPIVPIIPVIPK